MVRLEGHGLALEVARGWEARLWTPRVPAPAVNRPVVHLTNAPMQRTDDTYAVDRAASLRRGGVMAVLAEMDPAGAGRGLYADDGPPSVATADLDTRALQEAAPGRSGAQRFFSIAGRAFVLYVMAREGPGLPRALRELSESLATLTAVPL
jgi:hypothetical protein